MKKLGLFLMVQFFFGAAALACEQTQICPSDRVNYSFYVGTAVEVFSNGNVKIKVDGYDGFVYKSTSELGKGVPCLNDICRGSRVNFSSYVGTVSEVFTNENVKIKVDGYDGFSYRKACDLGVSVDCGQGQCPVEHATQDLN